MARKSDNILQKKSKHSKSTKKSRRRSSGLFKTMLWFFLEQLRIVFEQITDKLFGYFYDSHKCTIPPTTNPILLQDVTTLAKNIRDRKYTCKEIVTAFVDRAKQINPIINAIVDERFEDAVKEAEIIDGQIASGIISNKEFDEKPLLGIPFTTKDSTACKGMLYTLGLIVRQKVRAKEDADVVKSFKEAGAILIATTNIPEVNMWQETRNNVFGQTKNPYNTTRTVGGSSGGEASLIASCGTGAGIGTDIGGSLRMPAYFCGIFAHKPTSFLISTKGLSLRTGQEGDTMVVPGPMCRNASDLTPLLKVMLGDKQKQLKLDDPVNLNDINIFYTIDPKCNRISKLSGDVQTSLQRVVDFLTEKQSISQPEPVDFEEMKFAFQLWRHEMTKETTDLASAFANFQGSVNVYVEFVKKLFGLSQLTLAALFVLINRYVLPQENVKVTEERLNKLKSELLEKLGDNGVLLFPSYPSTAPYHYVQFLRPYNYGFWCVFNALKLPVTQVPLGLGSDGLPVGVQIVTAPYKDHLGIALAKVLEEEFGGWVPCLDDNKRAKY